MESPTETPENIIEMPDPKEAVLQQLRQDYADLQSIAHSKESAQVALSLKGLTPPEQVDRHALYDRIISGAGTPLVDTAFPAWIIKEVAAPKAD